MMKINIIIVKLSILKIKARIKKRIKMIFILLMFLNM